MDNVGGFLPSFACFTLPHRPSIPRFTASARVYSLLFRSHCFTTTTTTTPAPTSSGAAHIVSGDVFISRSSDILSAVPYLFSQQRVGPPSPRSSASAAGLPVGVDPRVTPPSPITTYEQPPRLPVAVAAVPTVDAATHSSLMFHCMAVDSPIMSTQALMALGWDFGFLGSQQRGELRVPGLRTSIPLTRGARGAYEVLLVQDPRMGGVLLPGD